MQPLDADQKPTIGRTHESNTALLILIGLIIVAGTLATFWPVLENGFVNWGDDADLVQNPHYRAFDPAEPGRLSERLIWMFTTIQMGHYQPLSWLTFSLDHAFWGMDPRGYHLTSLLLHALCAIAVFDLIRRLPGFAVRNGGTGEGSAMACAAAGAMLFAVHPLRVETIAWATERRGSLSGLLYVLAITAYFVYVERRRTAQRRGGLRLSDELVRPAQRAYRLSFALFAASLLAKEFGISLPVVLLILDAYPLRRLRGRNWPRRLVRLTLEKLPHFALAILGAAIALASSAQSGVARSLADYGIGERLAQCAYALMHYLRTTIWPVGLLPIYSIPADMDPLAARYLVSAAAVVVMTVLLWLLRRRVPAALTVWLLAVVILLPVLGLTQTGKQFAADRYTYLPAIGLSAIVAGGLLRLWRWSRAWGAAGGFVMAVVLVASAAQAWRQTGVWRDSETLWSYTLRVAPDCPVANTNMGLLLAGAQKLGPAMERFEHALRQDPRHVEALNNLGVVLAQQGRLKEAIERWRTALDIAPQNAAARENLARAESARLRSE